MQIGANFQPLPGIFHWLCDANLGAHVCNHRNALPKNNYLYK